MRIFVPTAIFHPDSGGPATYLYRLLPELLARGHEVRVLTFGDAEASGYPYPVQRVSLAQNLLKRYAAYLSRYRAELRRADLVYINNLGLPRIGDRHKPRVLKVVGDYAWERAVNKGWVAPETDIDTFQSARYSLRVEALKVSRAREVQTVDQVIVPSEYLQKLVIGWGAPPDRVRMIYNALEHQPSGTLPTRASARAALGIPADIPLLLTAARLTLWKGIHMVLDALAALPDIHLIIAGDGPQRAALQEQTARLNLTARVTFAGRVPRERMPLYMHAADYFILYSGYEGLSHVLLEALNAGTPVLASARGGNPEVVRDGVNGLLIAHPDAEALRQTITRAFEPGLQSALAANTLASLDKFAWPTLVEQSIATLESAAHP